MHINDFNFELPSELIARYPLAKRSASRLLCLEPDNKEIIHRQFTDILNLIQPGDLIVLNNTKVIPARVFGQKRTGGQIELLIERILDCKRILTQIRASKSPRIGDHLLFSSYLFSSPIQLEIVSREGLFYELYCHEENLSVLEIIESLGQIPLPPYMQRNPDENDKERYQTVYAKHKGSVAAPTAGLHFDEELLQQIEKKQVNLAYLTLHIGAGTFSPIRVENIREHKMHAEYLEVSPVLCEKVKKTKAEGKRVIVVGTTSLRALETASQGGEIAPYQGETSIFIYPGYTFRCADALITNLHLPRSTLLMLVCAFGGQERVMQAYRAAVAFSYRFYSYGDAMWVEPLLKG